MNRIIRDSFIQTRNGYSADRVIADKDINRRFVECCRQSGLSQPIEELNACLMNARKSGRLAGLPLAIKTSFKDEDEYRFASEVAARFLEHQRGLTVDQIICNPQIASEFDALAESIAPGHSSLQYRWAALNLRKSKRLRPESISHIVDSSATNLGAVNNLNITDVAAAQGVYLFYCASATLYIGETTNLRKRITKHLDHSDNKGLAHWFWGNGFSEVHLELRILPASTTQRVRCAVERELIRSRKPLFNIIHN